MNFYFAENEFMNITVTPILSGCRRFRAKTASGTQDPKSLQQT